MYSFIWQVQVCMWPKVHDICPRLSLAMHSSSVTHINTTTSPSVLHSTERHTLNKGFLAGRSYLNLWQICNMLTLWLYGRAVNVHEGLRFPYVSQVGPCSVFNYLFWALTGTWCCATWCMALYDRPVTVDEWLHWCIHVTWGWVFVFWGTIMYSHLTTFYLLQGTLFVCNYGHLDHKQLH